MENTRWVGTSAQHGTGSGTSGESDLACNEAVLSRGKRPGIHITPPSILETCNKHAHLKKNMSAWSNRAPYIHKLTFDDPSYRLVGLERPRGVAHNHHGRPQRAGVRVLLSVGQKRRRGNSGGSVVRATCGWVGGWVGGWVRGRENTGMRSVTAIPGKLHY